ncbi:MAG: tetratricopeptide repeat protein [Syntrophaceae bacterium]|nr:tetratricopeptide repeat protein [Syntrophaceae bacterium]
MKCPYCGKEMQETAGAMSALIAASCEGKVLSRHAIINVSRIDNKFRTSDEAIAKKLGTRGYTIKFDPDGRFYEIIHTPPKMGETNLVAQTSFDLGWFFWKSGDRKKAMEIWEENVKQFPSHRDSWYNLGLAYARENKFQPAIDCLKKAIEISPSDGQAWWYLGYNYRLTGDETNSKKAYAKAKELGWQQAPM